MFEEGGGKDDDATGWELNAQLEVPQHKMPAEFWIEAANGKYRTPAIDDVEVICVSVGARLWPKVEVSATEDAAIEIALEARIAFDEGIERVLVVGV